MQTYSRKWKPPSKYKSPFDDLKSAQQIFSDSNDSTVVKENNQAGTAKKSFQKFKGRTKKIGQKLTRKCDPNAESAHLLPKPSDNKGSPKDAFHKSAALNKSGLQKMKALCNKIISKQSKIRNVSSKRHLCRECSRNNVPSRKVPDPYVQAWVNQCVPHEFSEDPPRIELVRDEPKNHDSFADLSAASIHEDLEKLDSPCQVKAYWHGEAENIEITSESSYTYVWTLATNSETDGRSDMQKVIESTPVQPREFSIPKLPVKQKRHQEPFSSTVLFQSTAVEVVQAFPDMSSIRSSCGRNRRDLMSDPSYQQKDADKSFERQTQSHTNPLKNKDFAILTSTPTKNVFNSRYPTLDLSSINESMNTDDNLVPLRVSSVIVNSNEVACDSLQQSEVDMPALQEVEEQFKKTEEQALVEPLYVGADIPDTPAIPACCLTMIPKLNRISISRFGCSRQDVNLTNLPIDSIVLMKTSLPSR